MKICNVVNGINLLLPYWRDRDGYHLSTENGVLYAAKTDEPLSAGDVWMMIDFGWFQEEANYDMTKGFKAENYDPKCGWTAYV